MVLSLSLFLSRRGSRKNAWQKTCNLPLCSTILGARQGKSINWCDLVALQSILFPFDLSIKLYFFYSHDMCAECSICMYILQGWIPFRCRIYMLRVCNDHRCALGCVPGRTLVWRTINPFAQHQPQPGGKNQTTATTTTTKNTFSPHTYSISRFPLSQKNRCPKKWVYPAESIGVDWIHVLCTVPAGSGAAVCITQARCA